MCIRQMGLIISHIAYFSEKSAINTIGNWYIKKMKKCLLSLPKNATFILFHKNIGCGRRIHRIPKSAKCRFQEKWHLLVFYKRKWHCHIISEKVPFYFTKKVGLADFQKMSVLFIIYMYLQKNNIYKKVPLSYYFTTTSGASQFPKEWHYSNFVIRHFLGVL